MSGKFMNVKKFILPTLTMVIIASQLMGCAAANQSELLQMLNTGEQIEIEIAAPISEEQGEEKTLDWIRLDRLDTYKEFRAQLDDIMKITPYGDGSKNGIAYVDLEGNQEGNNTLFNAFMNRKFVANFYENDTANLEIQQIINNTYIDTDESNSMAAAINAYWNLLPDAEPDYFNPGQTLSRLEAMSLIARASTPVTENIGDEAFTTAAGQTDFTDLASLVVDDSYLGLSDKSLNESTANGTITRGEYIYMLVSNVFGTDRINSADIKKAQFNDCKDAGDIASQQKLSAEDTGRDYYDSAELKFTLDNPDSGCPTKMYQALAATQELGIISSDTRWDEGLTKSEAIQLYIDTVLAYARANGYATDTTQGLGENTGEVVEAQKPVEESVDNDSINVGGQDVEIEEEGEAPQESSIEADYEIEPIEPMSLWAATTCNLRSGPGTQYDIVGSLTYAQEIIVDGKVEKDGKQWFVLQSDTEEKQMVSGTLVVYQKPQQTTKPSGNTSNSTGNTTQQSGGNTQAPADEGEAQAGDPAPNGGVWEDSSQFDWDDNPYSDWVWE